MRASEGEVQQHYLLRLFVAGDAPPSRRARQNLAHLCQQYLEGRCRVEVVDVLENFRLALENKVLVTPTLILVWPPPSVRIVGTLSDVARVLDALRLEGRDLG